MFLNIQTDLIILKTFDQQFTLTTKKSLHIIFNTIWVKFKGQRHGENVPKMVGFTSRAAFLSLTC